MGEIIVRYQNDSLRNKTSICRDDHALGLCYLLIFNTPKLFHVQYRVSGILKKDTRLAHTYNELAYFMTVQYTQRSIDSSEISNPFSCEFH